MSMKRMLVFLAVMAVLVGVGRTWASPAATGTGRSEWDVAVPHAAPIPQEALRLRIIANSDSPQDQRLKEEVRNQVVTAVARWLRDAHNAAEARAIVKQHVPQIESVVENVVRSHGFHYQVHTDVGKVPFPTKIYGNQVYPAGEYEALRVTIGAGQGQNWWCVLFPPLCFIDIADGDAVPNTGGFPDLPPLETIQVPTANGGTTQVAVRVAALDYGEALWRAVQHWFGAV
jgi:stage II sporulation protein R